MNTEKMLDKVVSLVGNDYITEPAYLDMIEVGQVITYRGKSGPDTYGGQTLKFTLVCSDNGNGNGEYATWRKVKPVKVKKFVAPRRGNNFFDVDAL